MLAMNTIKAMVVAAGLTLWGLYLRADCLAKREWWADELSQWRDATGPLRPFWTRFQSGELTYFPGDYVLTYPVVQIFHDNKWGVSIPHIIITILGFYCLYLICRRYLKHSFSLLIAFAIFTFNAELIFHAFELRPYSVLATLGLAVFYCTETIVDPRYAPSPWKKFWIGVLLFLTVVYHAYGILIVAFCTMFSVLAQRERAPLPALIKHIAKFYIALGAVALPAWLWYAGGSMDRQISTHMKTFEFIPNPLLDPIGFIRNIVGNLLGNKLFYPLLLGPALAWVLPHSARLKYIGFLLVLVVLPLMLLCLADLSKGYWFLQRQFIWITGLFCFYVAWGWDIVLDFYAGRRKKVVS